MRLKVRVERADPQSQQQATHALQVVDAGVALLEADMLKACRGAGGQCCITSRKLGMRKARGCRQVSDQNKLALGET